MFLLCSTWNMQAKTVICEVGKGSSKNFNYGNRIKGENLLILRRIFA